MPDSVILLKTALMPAFRYGTKWLETARAEVNKTKKYNVSACVSYLEAARTAIRGLEDELDEILIEAEQVSQYYWEKKNLAKLAKRASARFAPYTKRPLGCTWTVPAACRALILLGSAKLFPSVGCDGHFIGQHAVLVFEDL
jgi:hypothetical protein